MVLNDEFSRCSGSRLPPGSLRSFVRPGRLSAGTGRPAPGGGGGVSGTRPRICYWGGETCKACNSRSAAPWLKSNFEMCICGRGTESLRPSVAVLGNGAAFGSHDSQPRSLSTRKRCVFLGVYGSKDV